MKKVQRFRLSIFCKFLIEKFVSRKTFLISLFRIRFKVTDDQKKFLSQYSIVALLQKFF
jgi:hypothetical protein